MRWVAGHFVDLSSRGEGIRLAARWDAGVSVSDARGGRCIFFPIVTGERIAMVGIGGSDVRGLAGTVAGAVGVLVGLPPSSWRGAL